MGGSSSKGNAATAPTEDTPPSPVDESGPRGDDSEDYGKPIEKGGPDDCSEGPVKKRRCTDILCLLLFIAHIGGFGFYAFKAVGNGVNINRLRVGQDYRGMFCGINNKDWDPAMTNTDLTDYPMVFYSMNTDVTMKSLIESTVPPLSSTSTGGIPNPLALKQQFDETLSPSGLANILGKLPTYFHRVCVQECPKFQDGKLKFASGNKTLHDLRTYNILENGPSYQTRHWSTARKAAVMAVTAPPMQMYALPETFCPYGKDKCVVAANDMLVSELMGYYCIPSSPPSMLSGKSGLAAAVTNATAGLTKDIKMGFDNLMSDCQKSWEVFIIVGFAGLIIGLLWMVALRFCVGVVVWVGVVLVFVSFAAGGALSVYKGAECYDPLLGVSTSDIIKNQTAVNQVSTAADRITSFIAHGNCTNEGEVFVVDTDWQRDILKYGGIGIWVVGAVYLLCIVCLCKRIRLGIAINKVAGQFVYQTKSVIFVPVLQVIFTLVWMIIWIGATAFVVGDVPNTSMSQGHGPFTIEKTADIHCSKEGDASTYCASQPAGTVADGVWSGRPCQYACAQPRYYLGSPAFWLNLFSFFWNSCFIVALGQITIAGAVATWYFATPENRGHNGAVSKGFCTALKYHTGSIAFGSFIVAVIKTIKWFLRYLARQAKMQHNQVMATFFCIMAYAVACFERCVKFLNKNAYIQIAIYGKNFCTSAKNAFQMIMRNCLRIAALGFISAGVNLVGILVIAALTTLVGYLCLIAMHPPTDNTGESGKTSISGPVGPCIMYALMGFIIGKLYMNVFGMSVDSILQCYIADEELAKGQPAFAPKALRTFVKEHPGKKDDQKGCVAGCC